MAKRISLSLLASFMLATQAYAGGYAPPAFPNITGNISINQMNSGTNASSTTVWYGDGTWKIPSGGSSVGGIPGNLQTNDAGVIAGILQSPIWVSDPAYGAVCNAQTLIASTSTTVGGVTKVCDSNYTFVSGDVGKLISTATSAAPVTPLLNSTIVSISSGCAVTAALASTDVTTTGRTKFGTDDTTAIQNAANASNTVDIGTSSGSWVGSGGRLIFPNNMCAISKAIAMRPGVAVSGQNQKNSGTMWLSTHTMAAVGYEGAFTGLNGNGGTRVYTDNQFHDMEIDDDAAFVSSYAYTAKCIDMVYVTRMRVYNTYMHGSPATCLGVDFPIELISMNNIFENTGKNWTPYHDGGSAMDFESTNGSSWIVAGNHATNPGRSFARNTNVADPVPTTGRGIISNNWVTTNNPNAECIEDSGQKGAIIEGNTCIQIVTGNAGFFAIGTGAIGELGTTYTAPGINGRIHNNHIFGLWYNGIQLADYSNSTAATPNGYDASDNTIIGARHFGVAVYANSPNTTTGLSLQRNHISLTGDACIGFVNNGTAGTIANPVLSSNTLYDCGALTATDALKSGIYVNDTVTNGTMQTNTAYDDGTGTQKYGYTLDTGVTASFQEAINNFTGVTTQARNILGTSSGTLFQLPSTNGTNGQFLATDGHGATSWASSTGATVGGSNAFTSSNSFSGTTTWTGSLFLPIRTVTASGAITVSATTDYMTCVNKTTGAATSVNLPASPTTGEAHVIKDCKGDAATNNITITPNSGNIDGTTTSVISTNYGSAGVVYNGTQWFTE